MSAQSSGRSQHWSTASRASASSSASHASIAVHDAKRALQHGDKRARLDNSSFEESVNGLKDGSPMTSAGVGYETLSVRSHRPGKSGGFLLEDVPGNTSEAGQLEPQLQLSEIAMGKRKLGDGDLVVPRIRGKRRPQNRRQHSLGSSPLATEIVNAQADDAAPDQRTQAQAETQEAKPTSVRSTENGNKVTDSVSLLETGLNPKKPMVTKAYDTDPAKIVSMALNLSESRRRNFSSGVYHTNGDHKTKVPLNPADQRASGLLYSNGGDSLRQHLQQQRRSIRNASPRSARSASHKGSASSPAQQEKRGSRHSSCTPDLSPQLGGEGILHASDATFARVEKAKEAFELFYEYRRLLQHLPSIPVVSSSRLNAGHNTGNVQLQSSGAIGRAYNPLQYIRNRKVRLRERKPLTAETQGWKDPRKVRAWVDTVKSEREGRVFRIDDRPPLPPFDIARSGPHHTNNSLAPSATQSQPVQAKHVERSHIDWNITPWDLLADVHWLSQDDNIKRIEGPSGNKIFDRPGTHQDAPSRASKESIRRPRISASLPRDNDSLDLRQMLATVARNQPKRPEKLRNLTSEPTSPVNERGRRNRWSKGFVRSREPSTSDDSDWDMQSKNKGRDHLDNIALEKQVMDLLMKEATENDSKSTYDTPSMEVSQKPDKFEPEQHSGSVVRPPNQRPKAPQRLKTDITVPGKHETRPRTSLDEQRLGYQHMSSDDFDSTNPNSPTTAGYIPSIAINFSAPTSPRMSAISPKESDTSKFPTFRRGRSRSKSRTAVSDHYFEAGSKTSLQLSRAAPREPSTTDHRGGERPTKSSHGFLSPVKSNAGGTRPDTPETRSLRRLKHANEPESKLRGFFKGGRIAEIVGSQVSRAGDILWRKEGGENGSAIASPLWSHASEDSDVDDADISALDSSPNDGLSRVTTNTEGFSAVSEKPRYHMSNLPSFRSPRDRREQSPKSPKASPGLNPLSREQLEQKGRGRSSRFDRLAPPKLDMRNVSPSPSPGNGRSQSQDPETNASPATSVSRSQSRVPSHDRLNEMLGIPGKLGSVSKRPTPTGLSVLEAQTDGARQRPALKEKRHWSISDRGVSAVRGTITKRDIGRVRALLLSSGVKANEIARRADEVPEKPSKLLQGIKDVVKAPLPSASSTQEHIVAARLLTASIENVNGESQDAGARFSASSVKQLISKIDAIDQRVMGTLMPLVRDSADSADTFSAELTTTYTLAVKQLNDSIDLILRRRRRRSRWLRRGVWAMLEWAVLGIMWMVWFIVVVIRLVRGTIAGSTRAVKWLFWL